ncbi:MAG: NAD(P)-dependent glycerol-3-phosphate dehydrogenase [Candidatus Aminicenantes bacterium]|nr:NAD(P)-dependent glycerol-3-phosphate dehydrogenase [Candidatus Aminicenantes bacterium]
MIASVVGGGSWGSAFALHLGRLNISTKLWVREQEVYQELLKYKENKTFLPGVIFPGKVSFHNDIDESVQNAEIVFMAVPSKFCRDIYSRLAPILSSQQIIVSLTKGIEDTSLKRMSEIMEECFSPYFSPKIVALSGPSFAREVADSHPTAVVVASKNKVLAGKIQHTISNSYFRTYLSNDIIGIEIAGALKNVMAIAAGILDGLEFGSNSIAALITRGIAELTRLGLMLGAKRETFYGLAGIGDLVLTCTGKLSRNRYVGYELGKGKNIKNILSNMKEVAEGVTTTLSSIKLAERENIEMPICEQVYQVLYRDKDPRSALQELMLRKLKSEMGEV